jgi:AraC-like DNA-binding protein
MDILSQVLESVRFQGWFFADSQLRAPWGITLRGGELAAVHAVREHRCWIRVVGEGEPVAFEAGDVAVLPLDRPHTVSDTPDRPGVPIDSIEGLDLDSGYLQLRYGGEGTATRIITASCQAASPLPRLVLAGLPALIRLPADTIRGVERLHATLVLAEREIADPQPGLSMVLQRLAEILFVQALRATLTGSDAPRGWLAALHEPRLSPVLAAVHHEPAHTWTLQKLAALAHLSRSAFAARFSTVVGTAPMAYVTQWRMHLATRLLRETDLSVAAVAQRVGYTSEPSFTRLFRAHLGVPPGRFRITDRQQRSPQ